MLFRSRPVRQDSGVQILRGAGGAGGGTGGGGVGKGRAMDFAPPIPPAAKNSRRPVALSLLSLTCSEHGFMAPTRKLTIRLSAKGRVTLPKSIRQRRRWDAGTRLIVEDTVDGAWLKAAPSFEPTRSDEVFGLLKVAAPRSGRSEERRVGKECRSRWSPYH